MIGKSYDQIFKEFEGHIDPMSVQGSGDVKYHLGASGKYVSPAGADIRVELAANPSHLETVDPIVLGMVPRQPGPDRPPGGLPVLPVLIHGDAAFAGQGWSPRRLAMSDITGYRVGGTIHLIVNNQIGFTTAPEFARSSLYCSDNQAEGRGEPDLVVDDQVDRAADAVARDVARASVSNTHSLPGEGGVAWIRTAARAELYDPGGPGAIPSTIGIDGLQVARVGGQLEEDVRSGRADVLAGVAREVVLDVARSLHKRVDVSLELLEDLRRSSCR